MKPNEIPADVTIIDILSDSSYALEHIKGAKNFSVYETAFMDKIQEAFTPDDKLLVYGFNNKTEEAQRAQYLLTQAGYEADILDGGLVAWKEAGLPVEAIDGLTTPMVGEYKVVPETSRVEWTGRNIGNKHTGNIKVKSGYLKFEDGVPKEGSVVIDMDTINNVDLDPEFKPMLEAHLKSHDFFAVEKYPTAQIDVTGVEEILGLISAPNYRVTADLTIKDIANKVSFLAFVHEKEGQAVMNAHFDIDRSLWDIKYGSERFFSRLGIHLIDDTISLDVILFGEKG